MDGTLLVLLLASVSAVAGTMLGASYVLTSVVSESWPLAAGAALGVLFTHWTHPVSGTQSLELNRLEGGRVDAGLATAYANALAAAQPDPDRDDPVSPIALMCAPCT